MPTLAFDDPQFTLPLKRADRPLHLPVAKPGLGGKLRHRRVRVAPLGVGVVRDCEQNEPRAELGLGMLQNP